MKNTFEKAQADDKVWSIRHGWGVITHIDNHKVFVRFDHLNWDCIFTICGKFSTEDLNPSLFWDEIKIDIPQKPIKMKLINGVEVPDITFKPNKGEVYFYPSIDCIYKSMTYSNNNELCKFLSDNDLCYPYTYDGQQAAILHTKALLDIKE
jgi:hypothetical protein